MSLTLSLAFAVPAPAQEVPRVVEIGVLPALLYDLPRFLVRPGESVALRFTNDDELAHNLVITRPGRRMAVVTAALALGERGPRLHYVPESDDVLWSVRVLAPGESRTLRFTAPEQSGVYPYVCTFPGHGSIMYGAMYVGTEMPLLREDPHVSPVQKATDPDRSPTGGSVRLHAFSGRKRPLVYRVFMPDASPAAIAVALTQDLSYCFDAGRCRLRYAWHGGFVDPWPVWKGNGNGLARLIGEKFYVEERFPLRLVDATEQPTPDFRGYRLVDGFPEFHYRVGDVDVRELVRPLADGTGLERGFRLAEVAGAVSFDPGTPGELATIGMSPVPFRAGGVVLSPQQAASFTVRIRRTDGR